MPLDPLDEFLPPRYRSAGRRPEANNDRTASANAPLSALRGWAAGTAGLAGDIEGLARAGISQLPPQLLTAFPALRAFGIGSRADPTPQMPTTEFYNEYLPGAQLNQTPTGKAFTTSGNLFGGTGTTTLAKYGIKSAKATGQALGPTAVRIGEDYLQRQGLMPGVIKPKGGNQLAGSFENSLKGLKTDVPAFDFSEGRNMKQTDANFIEQNFPGITQEYSDAFRASGMHSMDYAKKQIPWLKQNHPEIIDSLLTGKTKDQALNTWIDKQLTNYIKNDMATPGDPIRALAERGITYAEMAPLNTYLSDVLGRRRESVGFPAKGFGQSEAAQRWEAAADEAIHNAPARERLNTTISASEKNLLENPWLAKVPPETMTYGAYANSGQQLGFDHIVDELRNATDLASSLPPNLRLKSSSLPQLSVPQAVERVSQINAWRAAEAIKAEKAGMMGNLNANSRLEDPTTQLSFVDKPGMKWVDIPETTDKIGLNLCTTIGKQGGWCTQGEGLAKSYGSGPNRLTTLIDADGRPHAQAKITSIPYSGDIMDDVDDIMQTMSAAEQRKFNRYIGSNEFAPHGDVDTEEVLAWLQSNMPKSYKRYLASISGPSNITEIKPVSNDFSSARALEYKSRDPQYQNKITDSTLKFLNSSEWGTVTDLDHFNIVDLKDTHSVQRALREVLDRDLPKDRIDKFNYAVNFNPEANRFMSTRQFSDFLEPPEGFAKGGAVHFDEGGAAFGVFPQMKPRRALQDREAAANAPLSALRGYAAGTAGLPGDIEGLARAGISQLPPQVLAAFPALRAFGIGSRADPTPQLPTTEFYNEYLPGAQLNQTPTGKAFTAAGNLLGGAGSTTLARYGIKSAKATAKAIAEAAPGPASGSRAAQLGVIKMPGGNWLSGSVEESVSPMKRRGTPSIAFSQEEADDFIARGFVRDKSGGDGYYLPPDPVNNFIDKKIAPYIRDEMATPNDPLRAMAEKYAVDKPVRLAEVQGRIDAFAAKMEQTARKRGVPVEMLTSMRQQMIGLEKERDLLQVREALHAEILPTTYDMGRKRKERGFPEEGMGVSPQAKAWESKSDSFINSLKASDLTTGDYQGVQIKNPWLFKVPSETPVYNLYNGLNSDLGFDHLVDELRNATNPASGLPKNLLIDPADLGKLTMTQAVDRVADINAWRATQKIEANQLIANNAATFLHKEYPTIPGLDTPNKLGLKWVQIRHDPTLDILPKSLKGKQEGDEYVIRNSKGELLVSHDNYTYAFDDLRENYPQYFKNDPLKKALKYEGDVMGHSVGGYGIQGNYGAGGITAIREGEASIYSLRDAKGQPQVTIETRPGYTTFDAWKRDDKSGPERIIQIKGFRNKKPADEYLPFVQDFVKSGNWSEVNDLANAGLHDARAAGKAIEGRPAFMTDEELEAFKAEFAPKPEGMAHGGLVSTNFDPIKIQQIIAGLDDEYDPERIQQIVAQRESAYA